MWTEFTISEFGSVISDGRGLVQTHPNVARYSIIGNAAMHEFHLQIRDVTLGDGGTYLCQDVQGVPPAVYRRFADLVTLESNPRCTTTVPENGVVLEGRNYTNTCQILYRGGLTPKMTWIGPEPFHVSEVITPTEVISSIFFRADGGIDSRSYRMTTNFTEPPFVQPDTAGNAPNYEHISEFDNMHIGWGPKNMYVFPVKLEFEVGETITCFADALPPATYQWVNMDTGDVIYGQTVSVFYSWRGLNSTLRCLAWNSVDGAFYTDTYFLTAYVPDTLSEEHL